METLDRDVPLGELGKTSGPAPSTKFVRSVRRSGVIVPVLLREVTSGDGTVEYRIIDGNRRIAAARKARHRSVPARILIGVSADEAARLTLATNLLRSGNHVTEFWAIKHLERSGVTRQRIADDAGLTQANLRVRDRLSTLDRRVFVGFAEGKIATTVALSVSRMPKGNQAEMGALFAEKGRLLTKDVKAFITEARRRDRTIGESVEFPSERPPSRISPLERDSAPVIDARPSVPVPDPVDVSPAAPSPAPTALPPEAVVDPPPVVPEQVTGAVPAPAPVHDEPRVPPEGGRSPGGGTFAPPAVPLPSERRSPLDRTSREPVVIVHREPVRLPSPAPIAAPRTLPDDLRIAVRSIAQRAVELDIPEHEVTRVIQEVYRERSATQRRGQRSDVGERYA